MKTLGLIGGMSWESTVPYYRLINETVKEKLGGFHSARLLLYSVDFAEIEALQQAGDWETAGRLLGEAGAALARGGAEGLALCTNTMHKVAPQVESLSGLPLLHIADAAAAAIQQTGLQRVGLLGTRFTMEQDFYVARLRQQGLEVLIPPPAERQEVHRVIFEELVLGKVLEASRRRYQEIIAGLLQAGAQGVILGCTEIGLLIGSQDAPAPLFDTTSIHAHYAAEWMLESPSHPTAGQR